MTVTDALVKSSLYCAIELHPINRYASILVSKLITICLLTLGAWNLCGCSESLVLSFLQNLSLFSVLELFESGN